MSTLDGKSINDFQLACHLWDLGWNGDTRVEGRFTYFMGKTGEDLVKTQYDNSGCTYVATTLKKEK